MSFRGLRLYFVEMSQHARYVQLAAHQARVERLRGSCELDDGYSDHEILAFLRAVLTEQPKASWDDLEAAAAKRLSAAKRWRDETGLDAAVMSEHWREAELEYRRLLHYEFLGLDVAGRPVMVEHCGAWDLDRILEAAEGDAHRFATLHCMACEVMRRMPRPADSLDPFGKVVLLDFSGICTSQVVRHSRRLARAFLKLAKLDNEYYPDSLAKIYLVHVPAVVSALATLIQPFLPEATLGKVHVSRGVPAELVKTVSTHVLPVSLGGSRTAVFPYEDNANMSDVSFLDAPSFDRSDCSR